jgi:DNA polymerase-4
MDQIGKFLPPTKICSIDEVACRLMGDEYIEENALEIAHNIKNAIVKNVDPSLGSSIGIGPNHFLAKVASNLQKSNGLSVLFATELPKRLAHIELSDLPGIGRNMNNHLIHEGVTDLPTFWNLDPKHVRRIWHSVEGERLWYALHGIETTVNEDPVRRTVGHSHVLAPVMRPRHKARIVARRLNLKAARRMRRLGYFAKHYSLYVRFDVPKNAGERYKW